MAITPPFVVYETRAPDGIIVGLHTEFHWAVQGNFASGPCGRGLPGFIAETSAIAPTSTVMDPGPPPAYWTGGFVMWMAGAIRGWPLSNAPCGGEVNTVWSWAFGMEATHSSVHMTFNNGYPSATYPDGIHTPGPTRMNYFPGALPATLPTVTVTANHTAIWAVGDMYVYYRPYAVPAGPGPGPPPAWPPNPTPPLPIPIDLGPCGTSPP